MKKSIQTKNKLLIVGIAILFGISSPTFAKIKKTSFIKPKSIDVHFIKGINGEAKLTLQQKLPILGENTSFQFQDGQLAENIEFYRSPRCYLHFRTPIQKGQEISSGQVLKVSKIDNIYQNGSIHVTFWFDRDPKISDLSCISNSGHTLTEEELKNTLGNAFQISFTQFIEKEALFNTAPTKNARILSEDSAANNNPIYSARVILSDS